MLRDRVIAVAVDADVLNVIQDAEGKFARDSKMRLPGSCNSVSYITASGKILGTDYQMSQVEKAWQAWMKLPDNERKPGVIQVGDKGPIDLKHATVQLPAGGLILKVYG